MKTLTFDIETYINYTLFAFRDVSNGKMKVFEIRGEDSFLSPKKIKKIKKILDKHKIITFNGLKFDEPITSYALTGATANEIYLAVKELIVNGVPAYQFYKESGCVKCISDHIDIMDVARGSASLKLYGSRLHTKKLQDLPYDPETVLTSEQMDEVLKYCENDNILTEELYNYLKPDLDLRESMSEQYNMNLMSFKGAKIAEMVLVAETGYKGKIPDRPDTITYKPPKYIKFKTPKLKELFKKIKSHIYLISDTGNVVMPDFLKEEIILDDLPYKLGIGGVHMSMKNTSIIPDEDESIVDIDYKSLYPSLIIQNKYIPQHIGKKYLKVYQGMYDKRNIELKPKMKEVGKKIKELEFDNRKGIEKELNKLKYEYSELDRIQNGVKLIINSSFGQTGQRFSKIYDPCAMLSTTITGQLTLMMVVEKLSLQGYKTFYANTDGITLKVKTKDIEKVQKITRDFDEITGLEMEYNFFKASYLRDVNNFVNITDDNKAKAKGAYAGSDLEKNVQTPICYEAVKQYLLNKTPIKTTINNCKDVRQFVSARTVTGGAMWSGDVPDIKPEGWDESLTRNKRITKKMETLKDKAKGSWVQINGKYLGKVVRFYYSTDGKAMVYKKSGNKVPKSDGCKPLMDLPKRYKLPKDLDYIWYYNETIELLKDLGVKYEQK